MEDEDWCICVFFFKQKTAYEMRISDWSSDVCSSDLRLVGAAVRRAPQRGDAGGDAGEGIGVARAGDAHRRGRGVLLVVGVQDEDAVHGARQHRADLVFLAGHREHHVQEVLGIAQVVARSEEHTSELQSLMRISYAV